MPESSPSEVAPARPAHAVPDILVALGIASASAGAWLFHPGAGLILLGVALVLIGTRGSAPRGA